MKKFFERDKVKLAGEVILPSKHETPDVAIFLHGLGDNKDTELFINLAQALEKKNIASIRFDFSGQGKSEGKSSDFNLLSEIMDASVVLEEVRKNPEFGKIYVIAHSMGGVVGAFLAELYPDVIEKLVLLAPAASLSDYVKDGNLLNTSFDPTSIPEKIRIGDMELGGLFFRLLKTIPIYSLVGHYPHPVAIIQGTKDEAVALKYAEKFQASYDDSKLEVIEEADHSFTGEYQRQVINKVVKFLKEK